MRKATVEDFKKTKTDDWETDWNSDYIQNDEFMKYKTICKGGIIMLEKYTELDKLAAPNDYVARPTEEDIECVKHFVRTCRRYNIDFSEANSDEREFVLKMANKSMDLVTK